MIKDELGVTLLGVFFIIAMFGQMNISFTRFIFLIMR